MTLPYAGMVEVCAAMVSVRKEDLKIRKYLKNSCMITFSSDYPRPTEPTPDSTRPLRAEQRKLTE